MTAGSRAQWAEKLGSSILLETMDISLFFTKSAPQCLFKDFFSEGGEGGGRGGKGGEGGEGAGVKPNTKHFNTEMVTIYAHNTIIKFASTSQGYISVLRHNYNQKTAYCRIMHLLSIKYY